MSDPSASDGDFVSIDPAQAVEVPAWVKEIEDRIAAYNRFVEANGPDRAEIFIGHDEVLCLCREVRELSAIAADLRAQQPAAYEVQSWDAGRHRGRTDGIHFSQVAAERQVLEEAGQISQSLRREYSFSIFRWEGNIRAIVASFNPHTWEWQRPNKGDATS